MNRRILLLDAVLILILVRGWVTFHRSWAAYEVNHQPSLLTVTPQSGRAASAANSARTNSGMQDWMEITSKNPFSFDRSDMPIAAKVEEKPIDVGPKPVLFGTAFLGKDPMAMIASGKNPGGRSFRPMKVGENIDGWVIKTIEEKTVVVEAAGRQETLIMNDPTVNIPRDGGKTQSAAASYAPPPAPSAPAQSQPSPASAPRPPSPSAPTGTPGSVVKTPFGDIVVQ